MRLIGNKTRLLPEIARFLTDRGVRKGVFIDIFSGTSTVGRHFKQLGYRVVANDRLSLCYAKAVGEIEVSEHPPLTAFLDGHRRILASPAFQRSFAAEREIFPSSTLPTAKALPLARAIHLLNLGLDPEEGLIFRNYSDEGPAGRKYFRGSSARHIDAILRCLRESYRAGRLQRPELYLLLGALIDAADRIANISGTYGAYLKSWQQSALQPLVLRTPTVIESPLAHEAHQADANELVRRVKGTVLYIDPPYNKRQYAPNYHLLDLLAEYPGVDDLEAFEASIYGRTGLRPYGALRSDYCRSPASRGGGANAYSAMSDLVLSAHVDHVLISYNEEGILTREELGAILARFSGARAFDFEDGFRAISYKRFRSDSDRPGVDARGRRRYKVLKGRRRDELAEWLLYAARPSGRRSDGRIRPVAQAREEIL